MASRASLGVGVGSVILFAGLGAQAHITLTQPPNRYDLEQKEGPRGRGGGVRTPDVTVFEPGETISIYWMETINHPSHYRISFDIDGDVHGPDVHERLGQQPFGPPGRDHRRARAGGTPTTPASGDDGGCTFNPRRSPSPGWLGLLALLVLGFRRRV